MQEKSQKQSPDIFEKALRRTGFLAISLVILLLMLHFTTKCLAADDGTTPSEFSVFSLNRQLKVTASYSGDADMDNSLVIEWDEDGGDWMTLLGSVTMEHAPSPYTHTIGGLTNGTAYQVRLRWQDPDNAPADQIKTGLIPNHSLVHNALSTRSSKWGGTRGLPGGKYGQFTCKTCHERGGPNIKQVKGTLTVPDNTNWEGPASQSVNVVFTDPRDGSSDFGDDSDGHTASNQICEVCHSQNKYHNYSVANNDGGFTGHYNRQDCTRCHKHKDGFAHGGSGTGCESCHGHDAGFEYSLGKFSAGNGSYISHSTHTEGSSGRPGDSDDVKGPHVACGMCHSPIFPYFSSGVDLDGDGKFSLAETDVCNGCHSPDGPFDGVNDPIIGAKSNWKTGVYNGSSLVVPEKFEFSSLRGAGFHLQL